MAARREVLGILLMACAGIAVTAEMVFSMVMLQMQWPYWRITALSCFLCAAVVVAMLAVLKVPPPTSQQMKWVSLLGFFSAVYWGLGIVAVQIGVDPGDVAALTSINIVVAAIMGRLFLDERFRLLHMVAVTFSVSGAILIAQPGVIFASTKENRAPWYGYLCAIASGFLQGCFFICGRKAGDVSAGHLTTSALLFSVPLCGLLPFIPLVDDASFHVALELPWQGLGWTGVAFLTSLCSSSFSCAGSMLCPAAVSATVYTGASMFFGYLVQTMLFGASPEPVTVIGASLMLAAVSLVAFASGSMNSTYGSSEGDSAVNEEGIEGVNSSAMDDSDAESLASFIASEFSDFATRAEGVRRATVRFRGHFGQLDPVPPQPLGAPSLMLVNL
eukprot:gnl/MRDRNA2_/MRDRNA2_27017_c0_seq1.p1 gnl/MRDRNA2_/MRDRNA2_27017_c0~~gnl/MRDRNA2_/MRDRNA2_27017_c0_seq1.p1  ORF type:complete len:388 (-),score=60.16 gnl/MRDRNA2_/MRDRNA2_27017_c0_seq1:118-1281(-)